MTNLPLPKQLSIVIPLYNEEDRFVESFRILKRWLVKYPGWELVLVNDGSTDLTRLKVTKLCQKIPQIQLLSYTQNRGKGYAVRTGILAARQPWILVTDIDLSTPLTELSLFYPYIVKKADIIIGTRKVKGATITAHQLPLREWLGQQFTRLTNLWLGLDISDYTCGFKVFRRRSARQLFKKVRVYRWAYDVEVLFLAHQMKKFIVEVPVVWHNDPRTRVHLGVDIWQSLRDLIKIRLNFLERKSS